MTFDDQERQELVQSFVEEARELIDEAEPLIIDLEHDSADGGSPEPETLNTVFRLFHSIKGGAGFLDLPLLSKVTHEAETLLDLFGREGAHIEPEHIDLVTRTCDFLRELLDQIDTQYVDTGREEDADSITHDLKDFIHQIEVMADENDAAAAAASEAAAAEDAANDAAVDEGGGQAAEADDSSTEEITQIQELLTPELTAQFVTEAREQLHIAEEALIELEKNPKADDQLREAFRALHSFKGNCGFMGLKDMHDLSMGTETLLDEIRNGNVEPSSIIIGMMLEVIDFIQTGLKDLEKGGGGKIPATSGLLHLLQDTSGAKLFRKDKADVPAPAPAATEEKLNAKAPAEVAAPAAPKGPAAASNNTTPSASNNTSRQSVRVDVEKMDRLLDLVGELVIAEAMVVQNPDIQGLDLDLDRFERAVVQLNKITRDLQDISTAIRMIPLSGTFRRMHRLVRDVAKKAGKKVELSLEGEGTEVDKTVIEQITDPLVHVLRNSIDHGLEPPDERVKVGKGEMGSVNIRAFYVGSEVWISIKDDGKGLDREKILSKAVERELVSEEQAAVMEDDEVWPLIFQPGFSTAAKVTDVSGRGVGMDVVKRNLEAIRGKVEVKSDPGVGTEVVLRIPLTLAIIDGMLLRVGHQRYVLPIVTIQESLKVSEDMITRPMNGREVISLRDKLIPVIRLHELFHIDSDAVEITEGIVTVLEIDGLSFGLFVDELLGQDQIVIKGLSTYVNDHPCISGCTIMGDGGICLILDVGGILKLAGNAQGKTVEAKPAT